MPNNYDPRRKDIDDAVSALAVLLRDELHNNGEFWGLLGEIKPSWISTSGRERELWRSLAQKVFRGIGEYEFVKGSHAS